MNCPRCNSEHLQKKGTRAGKQRYFCKNCKASFTEGIPYKPAQIYNEPATLSCPKGESHHVVRDGKLTDGSQRYRCETCGLYFSTKTNMNVAEEIEWGCPYCEGTLAYSGYSRKGMREYKCKVCGKSCTADQSGAPIKREPPFHETNTTVKCRSCKSTNLKKAGVIDGIQRYTCRECGRTFLDIPRPSEDFMVDSILAGGNIPKLCKKYNYTPEELKKLMTPHYRKEIITNTQKRDIIKYGYYLKVPVDYMAEYIKCSEHKCLEVIKNYEKKLMSTTRGATA